MGVPIIIRQATGYALVFAIETLSPARLLDARGCGPEPVLAITARRAATLKAHAYDGDLARIVVPAHADVKWINAIADPAGDLHTPMKGPFQSLRGGDAGLYRAAITLAKAARLLPAVLVVEFDQNAGALPADLTLIEHSDITDAVTPLQHVVAARLPLTVSETGRLHIFRPEDGSEEHYAIEIGTPQRDAPVLARLHSACLTGDLLGSLKCDCGPQLRGAMAQMGTEGAGILLYLNQEGRGIGLANKMRAYALQDQGFDTVEANHRLGFEDDERDFRIGAQILQQMGFGQVRLLTNNPAKIKRLESCGLHVTERVPLRVGENPHNHDYLATKAAKSGHML
jgi:GTP cyclohydrolase II